MQPRAIDLNGNMMPPSTVGVMVLLDNSSSMMTIKTSMETAFAEFVKSQRDGQGEMWLTLNRFSCPVMMQHHDMEYVCKYQRQDIKDVGDLGLQPNGSTPLIDAMHRMLTEAKTIVQDDADETQRLLLVVITDGQENTSTKHSWDEVKKLIKELTGEDVELLYLGTEDAVAEAKTFDLGTTLTYNPTAAGVNYAATGMAVATSSYRGGGSASSTLQSFQQDVNETSGAE